MSYNDLHLAILCSSLGTIHIFRLLSDQEVATRTNQVKSQLSKKDSSSWLWSNIVQQVIPLNLSMTGSPVRIHLNDINTIDATGHSHPILQKKSYFAYIQNQKTLQLTVLTESGFNLQFDLQIEDLMAIQEDEIQTDLKAKKLDYKEV